MNNYIDDRIDNMIMSKMQFHKREINHYFANRHKGLAGIEDYMVVGLVLGAIRDYKVWKELSYRNYKFFNS